jgi:hypothetical protein
MPAAKASNPFYALLLVVGVAFAISACAYGVMTVRGLDPQRAGEAGLVGLMDQYGLVIMVVELVLLGLLTVLAIGTDEYWSRQAGGQESESGVGSRESEHK